MVESVWYENLDHLLAGSLIYQARAATDLTQKALAAELGVTQPAIAAYESGRRQPTVPTLFRIVRAAGFEVDFDLVPHEIRRGPRLRR